ncbi:hypothetical protein [Galbibacter orientalis]
MKNDEDLKNNLMNDEKMMKTETRVKTGVVRDSSSFHQNFYKIKPHT